MSGASVEHWDWASIRERCVREALRIVRRPHDAEEVVQEALSRAWRSRNTCRTPQAPMPWCLQITRNEAMRLLGRRANGLIDTFDADAELIDARSVNDAERVAERVDIERAMSALSEPDRLLVRLRYERDYSHPDIAALLEIPEATARVRLHRVHRRLRPML